MASKSAEKYHILHVDDNFDALTMMKLKFRDTYNITSTSNPKKALEILNKKRFEVVITDYDMPEMNGLQLLKKIKERFPDLPVIFYTGQGNEEVAREAFMAGVSDYLTKSSLEIAPWEKLVNAINNAIKRKISAEEIEETRRKFETLIQNIPDMVYRCKYDHNWTMEFVSENVITLTDYQPGEMIDNRKISYNQIIHPEDRDMVWEKVSEAVRHNIPFFLEYRIITKKGKIRHVMENGRAVFDNKGNVMALEGVILDDTKRKMAEEKTKKLNRVLMAVSDINQLIVREKNSKRLLQGACEILHKFRKYPLVWIGLIKDESPYPVPVSYAGSDKEYLENSLFVSEDNLHTDNPILRAIKEKSPFIRKNLNSIKPPKRWAIEAAKRNLISMVSIPLIYRERVFGVFIAYSDVKNAFTNEEVSVLIELSNDIAYALQAIEDEEARRKAEKVIKESEVKYRNLFNQANDAVFLETIDGKIIDVNTKACDMLGYSREEMLQLEVKDLIPQEMFDLIPKIEEKIKTKGYFRIEAMNKKKDGRIFPVEVSGSVIELKGKKRLLTFVADITRRKKAMEALRKSEKKYRSLFESSGDAIFIAEADTGIIVDVNKQAEILMEMTRDELLGLHQSMLHPPRSREKYKDSFKYHSSQEKSVDLESEIITKSGKIIPVIIAAAVFEVEGKKYVQGIFKDFSRYKEYKKTVEISLEASEERFRALGEIIPDIVFEVNLPDYKIMYMNRAAYEKCGFTREDFEKGLHLQDVLIEEDIEKAKKNTKRRLRNEKFPPNRYTIKRKDKSTFPGEVLCAVIIKDGKQVGLRGVVRDLTQIEELQKIREACMRTQGMVI